MGGLAVPNKVLRGSGPLLDMSRGDRYAYIHQLAATTECPRLLVLILRQKQVVTLDTL